MIISKVDLQKKDVSILFGDEKLELGRIYDQEFETTLSEHGMAKFPEEISEFQIYIKSVKHWATVKPNK